MSGAVIVTTPQEVSLADVRKELSFCKKAREPTSTLQVQSSLVSAYRAHIPDVQQVGLPVIGVVENMSGALRTHADSCRCACV